MSGNYVAPGYVSRGYVQGGSPLEELDSAIAGSTVGLSLFISKGDSQDEATLIENVRAAISDGNLAILLAPEFSKLSLIGASGAVSFIGVGDDVLQRIDDLGNRISSLESSGMNMTACIKGNDGSVVAGAVVEKTGPSSFAITVPDNIAATEYQLVLNEDCGG